MGRHYAPSRDGQRFLIANATSRARAMPITVVLNWQEESKQRVPTR